MMPYKNDDRRLAYVREWSKNNRGSGAHSPTANDVMLILSRSQGPMPPSEILACLQAIRPTVTAQSLGVCLNRIKEAGRIKSLGYGQWVPLSVSGLAEGRDE